MTTNSPAPFHSQDEYCDECERQTDHTVRIEIRQEGNPLTEPEGFSREPYRIAKCRFCETENSQRMNNA